MQTGDLASHRGTQLGVQVAQRLVQQEDGRVADHGTAQGHALALAAGKRLGLALEQVLQIEDLGSFVHTLVDLVLRDIAQRQTEGDVLVDAHMRIQGVVLEHHGDIAVFRGTLLTRRSPM